jgi:U3 small nucleolar RNA-associated protein 25
MCKASDVQRREEKQDSESESPSEDEEELDDEDSSEGEDADPLSTVRSYAALMQSLAAESVPHPKRRKLEHVGEPKQLAVADDDLQNDANGEDADRVEEEEEGPETATDGLLEDDDEPEDSSDPFEAHFADPDDNVLAKRLKSVQKNQWTTRKAVLPSIGKAVISLPEDNGPSAATALPTISGPSELKLKQKLVAVMSKQRPNFDVLEKSAAPLIFNYQDILYCERTPASGESLRRLACLHAVNHVFK